MCDECWDEPQGNPKVKHEENSLECLNSKIESIISFMLRGFKGIIENDNNTKNHILNLSEQIFNPETKINNKISNKICEFERKGLFNKTCSNDSNSEHQNALKENNNLNNIEIIDNSVSSKLRTNTVNHLINKKMFKQEMFKWKCVTDCSDVEIHNYTFKKLTPQPTIAWAQVR